MSFYNRLFVKLPWRPFPPPPLESFESICPIDNSGCRKYYLKVPMCFKYITEFDLNLLVLILLFI